MIPNWLQIAERAAGCILIYSGASLQAQAALTLGKQWRARPAAGDKLVTTGWYAYLRHPIYVFHLVATIGWCLVFQWKWLWLIALAELIMQVIRATLEERALRRKWGRTYDMYKKQTWF
jgi:protein-S-isoprenylcysteine O-methyltransferase Ste14